MIQAKNECSFARGTISSARCHVSPPAASVWPYAHSGTRLEARKLSTIPRFSRARVRWGGGNEESASRRVTSRCKLRSSSERWRNIGPLRGCARPNDFGTTIHASGTEHVTIAPRSLWSRALRVTVTGQGGFPRRTARRRRDGRPRRPPIRQNETSRDLCSVSLMDLCTSGRPFAPKAWRRHLGTKVCKGSRW